jgi:hypothetical protein
MPAKTKPTIADATLGGSAVSKENTAQMKLAAINPVITLMITMMRYAFPIRPDRYLPPHRALGKLLGAELLVSFF